MDITSLSLFTDLYQLTMAYGYWKKGIADRESVFHLYFRKRPFNGMYAICAGLQTAIEFLENFRFQKEDIFYLASLKTNGKPLFEERFLQYLENLSLSLDIDAMPEGTVAFSDEPLIRVRGPILQAQLIESALLNIINFQTLIATKSARICLAASPNPVIEFGMRRAQGIDGALSASRAAYIGGCQGSSHVLASKHFGIPVKGTHAHSWVMACPTEEEAFYSFAEIFPHSCVLLIDTFDSIEGTKKAIKVAKKLKEKGINLFAVRLDSGDLTYLSIEIRKMLDKAGFDNVQIMASNDLDEYLIKDLKQQGAKITIWGVGTKLVTAKDQPALDGVYKLSAIKNEKGEWEDRIKISDQTAKVTTPGILQVRRYAKEKLYVADAIYDEKEGCHTHPTLIDTKDSSQKKDLKNSLSYTDLLIPIFKKGKLVYSLPPLEEIQKKAQLELQKFQPRIKRFINPEPYFVGIEKTLFTKKIDLIQKIRNQQS